MDLEWLRKSCLALPGVAESVQWGNDLVFKVGGKIFAVAPLEPGECALTFKCTPEEFAELIERPGFTVPPYTKRGQWLALESWEAVPRAEVLRLVCQSYDLIVSKLPRRLRPA